MPWALPLGAVEGGHRLASSPGERLQIGDVSVKWGRNVAPGVLNGGKAIDVVGQTLTGP